MGRISRRDFVAFAVGAAAARSAPSATAAGALTAQDIVDRVKRSLGIDWKPETVDTFKAGDPSTAARGIVTTAMATMDVLRQAVKAGANVIVTYEPTFFSRADLPIPAPRRGAGSSDAASGSPSDAVFAAKNEFITRNGLVVWRFSDHWRLRRPDPLAQGLIEALSWSGFVESDGPSRLSLPGTSLGALGSHIRRKLNSAGGIRIVGDSGMRVQRIGILAGPSPIQSALKTFADVDAIVAGEVREWESVEYARDVLAAGRKKGLILIGRIVSEDPGMKVCAQWMKNIVPELATRWIPVGDPYWRPF
jgi:putative NIF3 family GTP cyclohydrolase 1 type 2